MMKREIGAVGAKRRVATSPSLSKQRGREIKVWVPFDTKTGKVPAAAGRVMVYATRKSAKWHWLGSEIFPATLLLPPRRGR